jgi:hypothetical protein
MEDRPEAVDKLQKLMGELFGSRVSYIEHVMGDAKFSLVLFAVATGPHGESDEYQFTMRADITSKNFPDSVTGVMRNFIQPSLLKELDGGTERKSFIEDTELSS